MALSDMKVFNEYFMSAAIDRLEQKTAVFNEASNGALRLATEGFVGDFLEESFFANLTGTQARVNRYTTNAVVPAIDLTEEKIRSVKIAGRFGPIRFEPSQFSWLQRPTEDGITAFAEKFSDAVLKDMVNTAVSCLVASLNNNPQARFDAGTNPITFSAMNDGQALFGDSSENIVAFVMTGKTAHKIIGQNIQNASHLFTYGSVRVLDVLGTIIIRTDAPGLFQTGTPSHDFVLGLTDSAAVVTDVGQDIQTATSTLPGKERIETIMQTDYTFSLKQKGYSWGGPASPSTAQLGTGTNWTKVFADVKNTAGVIVIGQA